MLKEGAPLSEEEVGVAVQLATHVGPATALPARCQAFLPDDRGVMAPAHTLHYNDAPWLPRDGLRFLHPDLPHDVAAALGVQSLLFTEQVRTYLPPPYPGVLSVVLFSPSPLASDWLDSVARLAFDAFVSFPPVPRLPLSRRCLCTVPTVYSSNLCGGGSRVRFQSLRCTTFPFCLSSLSLPPLICTA